MEEFLQMEMIRRHIYQKTIIFQKLRYSIKNLILLIAKFKKAQEMKFSRKELQNLRKKLMVIC